MKTDMSQGILQYVLPQEEDQFRAAQRGVQYAELLNELKEYLKSDDDFFHKDDITDRIKILETAYKL